MTKKATKDLSTSRYDLTTAQVSYFTKLTTTSLYAYVRIFSQYFSEGANIHTAKRRWTQEDLEIVWAIKSLYGRRLGKEKIKEMLATGWRQLETKELMALLIEETLAAKEEMAQKAKEVNTLKKILEERKQDTKVVQELWIRIRDLQHEFEMVERAWKVRTVVTRAMKKKWGGKYHGEPPQLYPSQETP
jgi:hypothetical protein